MFSEDNSTTKNSESIFRQELHESARKELGWQNPDQMENLYSSSLALVEREVAGGNTQAALAYLKTYHQCQAINLQMLNLILPGLQLPQPQKSCSDGSYKNDELNNEYLQSLEALLEPQEEEDGSIADLPE